MPQATGQTHASASLIHGEAVEFLLPYWSVYAHSWLSRVVVISHYTTQKPCELAKYYGSVVPASV